MRWQFRKLGGHLVAGLIALLGAAPVQAADLTVYTEEYPPYNFSAEDGSVSGFATERVRQVLDAAGLDYTIQVVPWTRAMLYARTREDALIYSVTRTPGREGDFDWLVPVGRSNFYLFVRAEETRAVTLEALQAGEFTAACVSNDLGCELIRWTGIPEDRIVAVSDSMTSDYRMVVAGRADIYISDMAVNAKMRRREGFDPDLTKPALRLEGKAGFYLAAGHHVPADVRARIHSAYEALMASGNYVLPDPQGED